MFLLSFDFHNDFQIEKDTSEPSATPGPQPTPLPQPQSPLRRRGKPPNPWVIPWILQREERGYYRPPPTRADIIHTHIPGYQNFVRMSPAFFLPH